METIVRCAQVEDTNKLISFLEEANLGIDGIKESIEYFLLMEDEAGKIQATLGIEPLGKQGLLRSLAVTPRASENDLLIIFEQMLKLAKEKELESLYLATNKQSSLSFFSVLGFEKEEEENLPQELFASDHVKHILTVDKSLFMVLRLG
jgi:N-acetylglutamate synthase-like GNAT family acetyltransferase